MKTIIKTIRRESCLGTVVTVVCEDETISARVSDDLSPKQQHVEISNMFASSRGFRKKDWEHEIVN